MGGGSLRSAIVVVPGCRYWSVFECFGCICIMVVFGCSIFDSYFLSLYSIGFFGLLRIDEVGFLGGLE